MAKCGVYMITDYYTESFTVETPSTVQGSFGAYTPTWSTAGTFKGWIDYITGRDTLVAKQYIDVATHIIGCSSTNTWVKNKHRIKDSDNLIYRVLHTDNPIRKNYHLEILLEFNKSDNLST